MAEKDVSKYTIKELLQFAEIYDKTIKEVTKKEIKDGLNKRIIRSMQLQKPTYTQFFHKVKEKLFAYLDLTNPQVELGNMDVEEKDKHDKGWSKPYNQIIIKPVGELPKRRAVSSEIVDDEHATIIQKKLDPVLEAGTHDNIRGEMNVLFRQVTHHCVVINSHNRKLISQQDPEKNLEGIGSINSTGKCGSLEESFIQNPKMYAEKENNFTFSLSTPLKRVTKLKASQIEIPISWYTFKPSNGTTSFMIGPSTLEGEKYYPIDVEDAFLITIPAGNYTTDELIAEINTAITATWVPAVPAPPQFLAPDPNTNKVTIEDSGGNNFHLFFYLEKTPAIPAGTFPDQPDPIPAVEGMIIDPVVENCINVTPKVDYNLGWLLGFRQTRYSGASSYTSESTIDTFGPRTINVEVEDFTHNSETDKAVTLREEGDTFSRPRGVEDCLDGESKAPFTPIAAYFDPNTPNCRLAKHPTHPDRTINNDPVQQINKNKFWARQQLKQLWQPIPNRTRPYGNRFARLQVKKDGPILFAEPNDPCSEKKYFGPVTISRLNLKLYDERGDLLDLNGQNWSMRMDAESIYQF